MAKLDSPFKIKIMNWDLRVRFTTLDLRVYLQIMPSIPVSPIMFKNAHKDKLKLLELLLINSKSQKLSNFDFYLNNLDVSSNNNVPAGVEST